MQRDENKHDAQHPDDVDGEHLPLYYRGAKRAAQLQGGQQRSAAVNKKPTVLAMKKSRRAGVPYENLPSSRSSRITF